LKPKLAATKTKGAIETDIGDGFWCSEKFKNYIAKRLRLKNTSYPWVGRKIYHNEFISNDKAFVVENGVITQVYEIDWGMH